MWGSMLKMVKRVLEQENAVRIVLSVMTEKLATCSQLAGYGSAAID